jgi:hypothetical protein
LTELERDIIMELNKVRTGLAEHCISLYIETLVMRRDRRMDGQLPDESPSRSAPSSSSPLR